MTKKSSRKDAVPAEETKPARPKPLVESWMQVRDRELAAKWGLEAADFGTESLDPKAEVPPGWCPLPTPWKPFIAPDKPIREVDHLIAFVEAAIKRGERHSNRLTEKWSNGSHGSRDGRQSATVGLEAYYRVMLHNAMLYVKVLELWPSTIACTDESPARDLLLAFRDWLSSYQMVVAAGVSTDTQQGKSANSCKVFFTNSVPLDVHRMASLLAADGSLSKRGAARKSAESDKKKAASIVSRFYRLKNRGDIRFDPPDSR